MPLIYCVSSWYSWIPRSVQADFIAFCGSLNNRISWKIKRNLNFFYDIDIFFFLGRAPVKPWWSRCACAVRAGRNTWNALRWTTTGGWEGAKWRFAARSRKCCRRSLKVPNWPPKSANINSVIAAGIARRPGKVCAKSSPEVNSWFISSPCFPQRQRTRDVPYQIQIPYTQAGNVDPKVPCPWQVFLPRRRSIAPGL